MRSPVIAILRRVIHSMLANRSPHQLAAGFTLGMIIGLMPKGNLIVLSLCVLLFSLRINKGLALFAALVFTAIGPYCDPFSHKLGISVLSIDLLQPVYASVLCLPLAPWLGFHNTVVTGSLLVGLYVAYPVYWGVRGICNLLSGLAEGTHSHDAPRPLPYPRDERLAAEGTA